MIPALGLAICLLVACSGDDSGGSASPAPAAPGSPAAPSEPTGVDGNGSTDAPPFPANEQPDIAPPSADAALTVRDIRLGRHDGFDRVVFEVGGTGTPGWHVRYVDAASSQGSGDPVAVAGNAVLQVTLTGMGYPYDTGVPEWSVSERLAAADTETVTEVVFDGTFEATTVAFVGTRARTAFRVYLIGDPVRVVVEVADAA